MVNGRRASSAVEWSVLEDRRGFADQEERSGLGHVFKPGLDSIAPEYGLASKIGAVGSMDLQEKDTVSSTAGCSRKPFQTTHGLYEACTSAVLDGVLA